MDQVEQYRVDNYNWQRARLQCVLRLSEKRVLKLYMGIYKNKFFLSMREPENLVIPLIVQAISEADDFAG